MGRSRLKNSKLDKTVLQKPPSPERPSKSLSSPETPQDLPTKALDRICIGFIFLLSMFIYLSTVYPSLPGGDSGELMVTAKEFGVAHPPGYPLFTILAKLVILGLPCGSTAFRVNILSCILGSVTNALLGACLLKATKNVTVALIICAMTGFSRLFWIWNITGEVFSLNNLLCMALFLVMYDFCLEEDTEKKLKLTYVLAILSGFAMTNQHTSSMFVMALICFVLSDLFDHGLITTHNVINLTIAGFSPMLLYLQLPLASYLRTARVTWGDHRTGEGFLFHFFRKDYGTLKLVKDDAEVDIWRNYSILTADLMRELTIPVLLLALFSTTAMIWREHGRKFVCFLKTTLVLYTGFFCTFANITDVEGIYKGVLERFWLQASLPLVIMAGIGLQELIRLAKIRKTLMMPVAFLIIAARIHSNYGECDQSENYHVEQFGRHVLSQLPNNTILFTSGDLSTNTFRYLTIAENVRPDVDVLDLSFIGSRWYIPMLGHHMSTVKFPGIGYSPQAPWNSRLYNLEQFLDRNLPTRPVFVCLKPRAIDTVSLRKYKVLPFSFCSQFLPKGAIDPLIYGKQIPTPNLDTYLPPRTELFGDQTWENVLIHEYWDAVVKPGRWLWDAGENTRNIEKKKQLYLAAYEVILVLPVPDMPDPPPEYRDLTREDRRNFRGWRLLFAAMAVFFLTVSLCMFLSYDNHRFVHMIGAALAFGVISVVLRLLQSLVDIGTLNNGCLVENKRQLSLSIAAMSFLAAKFGLITLIWCLHAQHYHSSTWTGKLSVGMACLALAVATHYINCLLAWSSYRSRVIPVPL